MSVMMGLRVPVDVSKFLEVNSSNEERLMAIVERAKEYGAIHHRFYGSLAGDELLVVDEWPDAESFQRFFEASGDIQEMMGEAGVTTEPQIAFWRELDTPDSF
jgi:hypothetical protein